MANEKDKEGRRNDGEVERKGCGRRESGANRDIGKQGAARGRLSRLESSAKSAF